MSKSKDQFAFAIGDRAFLPAAQHIQGMIIARRDGLSDPKEYTVAYIDDIGERIEQVILDCDLVAGQPELVPAKAIKRKKR